MSNSTVKLDTHYIKTGDFRTVYGSGIYGGFAPDGQLNMFVYTERVPIPQRITLDFDVESQTVVGEQERDVKSGVIREVQFGILFNIDTAEAMLGWLKSKIEEYKQVAPKPL